MKWLLRILIWAIRIVVYGTFAFVLFLASYTFNGGVMPNSQKDLAHVFVTETIDTPLLTYKMNMRHYPTTEQGLMALLQAPPGVKNWHGPYLTDLTVKHVPFDPWRTEYHYRFPGLHNPTSYDCWSSGPDKIDGTADDIGNW